ncbi:MAG: GNAT family N-acetyltransferase [Marivibrio sp.]|uniref:GNAT family N-acetyltransferase n=1 Tax=Marivibrio sp. TaxID=2039719 RepID=UPI0032F007BF
MSLSRLTIREARRADLEAIVALLAEDFLGAGREDAAPEAYAAAFAAIEASPDNRLFAAEADGAVIGCFQLTLIPNISLGGGTRAQIEGVRTAGPWRGRGVGAAMMRFAIAEARAAGCVLVQLTTNAERKRARAFYQRLGFVASHDGMKLAL